MERELPQMPRIPNTSMTMPAPCMEEVCVCVTDEEGVVLEDVSGVDGSHVLIGCVASVLVVLNFSHRCFLLDRDRVRMMI